MTSPVAKETTEKALGRLIIDILLLKYPELKDAQIASGTKPRTFYRCVSGLEITKEWLESTIFGETGQTWFEHILSIAGDISIAGDTDYKGNFLELCNGLPDSQPERKTRRVIIFNRLDPKDRLGELLQDILLRKPEGGIYENLQDLNQALGLKSSCAQSLVNGRIGRSPEWYLKICGNTGITWFDYIKNKASEEEWDQFLSLYSGLHPLKRKLTSDTLGYYFDIIINFCFQNRQEASTEFGLELEILHLTIRNVARAFKKQDFFLTSHNGKPPIIDVITDRVASLTNQHEKDRAIHALAKLPACISRMRYSSEQRCAPTEVTLCMHNQLTQQWRAAMGEVLGRVAQGLGLTIDPEIISGDSQDVEAYFKAAKHLIAYINRYNKSEKYAEPLRRLEILCPEIPQSPTPSAG